MITIISILIVSGCTSTNETNKVVIGSNLVKLNSASWYEYSLINSEITDDSGVNHLTLLKYESKNESYNGLYVRHVRITRGYGNSSEYIMDLYWNLSDNWLVDQDGIKYNNNSSKHYLESIPVTFNEWINPMFSWMWVTNLTKIGSEVLIINGTTYHCDKYIGTNSGITYNVWIDPSVPVPIKIIMNDTMMELIGWKS